MAQRSDAPYRAQDRHEISEMLRGLEANVGKGKGPGGFSCRKNTFNVDNSSKTVDSWKMQDWDYKKPNLPTYARGLFTTTRADGQAEIAVRGYDKFFNCGEVRETEWANIEKSTRGPYELSVKENGCIIFLAGLEDGTLLVCSKHSTGGGPNEAKSHAKIGEQWVERHLAKVGKSQKDLAFKLRQMNATAVAELCDDEFEEHVLAYTPDQAGLYLHGINLNVPEFTTYPHHLVDLFADEWGFKKTTYVVMDDIGKVKGFLDGVAETGHYNGRDTEGFVIRCQSNDTSGIWHDWFFKYKFEEPYLMYRQWRECTKAIIADRDPKYKKHKKITEDYLVFARRQLHANPNLATAYQNNHGIIKMRDDFLTSRGLRGSDIIRQEAEDGEVANHDVGRDVFVVPVATIGCGKTTVALALCHLFGWGHVQNDNITVKKGKPQAFVNACVDRLSKHAVVVADRNNHQKRERKQLIDDAIKIVPNARFVALHYAHDRSNYDQIRQATRNRVLNRGDNHQTIHMSKGEGEIVGIMEGFMGRFEPLSRDSPPDDGFYTVIDLDPVASSRENLETVVSKMYAEYPKLFQGREMPTQDDMDGAINLALTNYTVDIKHSIKGGGGRNGVANGSAKQKDRKLEYFGAQLNATRVGAILDAVFRDAPADQARMFNHLKQQRRVQAEFHVTLIHRASAQQHPDYWAKLSHLYEQAASPSEEEPRLGQCKVRLERVVWDDRLMAFVVRLWSAEDQPEQWRSVNATAHVTVGTASANVKPVESNALLAKWLEQGCTEDNRIREAMVKGHVELDAVVRGVLQKR